MKDQPTIHLDFSLEQCRVINTGLKFLSIRSHGTKQRLAKRLFPIRSNQTNVFTHRQALIIWDSASIEPMLNRRIAGGITDIIVSHLKRLK